MPKIPNNAREFVVNENGEIIDQPMTRKRVTHPEGGPLMTKQSMAADTDVNHIMARWIAHGVPPLAGNRAPTYGDFSSGLDFQTALNQVMETQAQFDRLPAHIRAACHNDPAEFLDLALNPARVDELVKLGLKPEQLPAAAPAAEGAPAGPAPTPQAVP